MGWSIPAQDQAETIARKPRQHSPGGVSPSVHQHELLSADQKDCQGRGESQGGWRMRRGFFPAPHPPHCLLRTPIWRKSPPPHLGDNPGSTLMPLLLFLRVLPLMFGAVGFPPHHMLGQDNPLGSLHRHPRLYNINTGGVKRKKRRGWKLGQRNKGKLKRTHPGTDDSLPQGNQVRPGTSVHPKGKDPADAGIDLCIPKLGLEEAIRSSRY
jgi:hypothetical protein